MICKYFLSYNQLNYTTKTRYSVFTVINFIVFFANIHSFRIRCLQHALKELGQWQQKTGKVDESSKNVCETLHR